ncbi:unnamed protein product [Parajaminaea phylloscopi]
MPLYILALAALGVVAAYLLARRPLPHTALDRIPGPPECRKSDLLGRSSTTGHWELLALHRRYGPLVRIGPTHVSVASPVDIKSIYAQGTLFLKTPWYNLFTERGQGVVFNIQDKTLHRNRRRIVSHAFSPAASRTLAPFIRRKALAILDVLAAYTGEPIDVATHWKRFAGDVALQLSLARDERQVEDQRTHQLIDDLAARGSATASTRQLAARLERWGKWAVIPGSADVETAKRIVRANHSVRTAVSDASPNAEHPLARIIAQDGNTARIDRNTLCLEARGFILAASDTTANLLTMATYHIARHPAVWTRLHHELLAAIPSQSDLSRGDIGEVPYLAACIKEAHRLTPSISRLLPRLVPPSGACLDGYDVPPKTTIGSSIFVHHRWPADVWGPDEYADAFHPERWLDTEPQQLAAMNRCLTPYSEGPRACLGRHIAELEIHTALAALFRFFRPTDVLTPDEEMVSEGFFVASPRGRKCNIRFEAVE